MEKNCLKCQQKFEAKRKDTQFCSTKCKKAQEYLRQFPLIKKQCQNCQKDFETRKEKTVFCSISCSNIDRTHEKLELKCKECNRAFIIPFVDRGREFCSKSCSSTYSNKNRNEEEVRKKISNTKKQQFSSGEVVHPFLGKHLTEKHKQNISLTRMENKIASGSNNPMFGKNHSILTREKISTTRANLIQEGKIHGRLVGEIFSKKGGLIKYRSNWEKDFITKMDNDDTIFSFIYEPNVLKYFYEDRYKNYIPDFLVIFNNGSKKLIEIKPSFFQKYKINVEKFSAAKKYCEEKGMIFEVWTEKTNPYLETT